MSSLTALVAGGPIFPRVVGDNVRALQLALGAAGYRVALDGDFGPGTLAAVKRFQRAHGLKDDGIVGPITAALLDAPHDVLVATARPSLHVSGFPHDDTASLIAFYGDPRGDLARWQADNVVAVTPPWQMAYEGQPIRHIQFHRKAAPALAHALDAIWTAYGLDQHAIEAARLHKFSGSGNFRPIRGSSRLSCHAFWAAIDLDAEDLPLGRANPANGMPSTAVDAFKAAGAFWGGDYAGRKDPMHFQFAHE